MQYQFQSSEKTYQVQLKKRADGYLATVDSVNYEVEVLENAKGQLSLRLQGTPVNIQWVNDDDQEWLALNGCTYLLEKPKQQTAPANDQERGEMVLSPLPAQVRAINVAEGDVVEKDAVLLLVEAMKMELQVRAPVAGKVRRVLVSANQTVQKNQELVEILP